MKKLFLILMLFLTTVVCAGPGQIVDANSDAYYIATPWDNTELFDIQYVQIANVMYLASPNHPPQKLTRNDHADWTIEDVNIITGPFQAENTTATTITPSATTGTVTLAASTAIFDVNHVGGLWEIGHRRESAQINGILDANESSSSISCATDFDYNIQGTWVGTVTLQRSFDAGSNWETVYPRYNNGTAINEDYSDTETSDGVTYRVTMSGYTSGTATYNFSVYPYIDYGIVEIATFSSSTSVTATVKSTLTSTDATTTWSEGYWSDYRGWPRTIAVHEQRLMFGGSASFPQTIWTSVTASGATDDYEDFSTCTNADRAVIYILPGQNPIQWMLSQTYLLIGTSSGTGRWGSDDDTQPITPTNPTSYREQARHGSAYIQAVLVGDAVLYVERGGERVRELAYDITRERFTAPDMTVLAEHITESGIKEIAYQSRPDIALWCVRNDGDIAVLTYERFQDVIGWTRITTDGDFESIAVIPDMNGGEDKVWTIVNRDINSTTVRYVEQFQPRDWGGDQNDCFFVDSGLSFNGGPSVSITDISQADPAVVTVATWPTDGDATDLADGDQVKIASVVGMTEVNSNVYTIDDASVGGKTFSLNDYTDVNDIDSTGYTAYTSGGTVQMVEKNFTNLTHLEGETVIVLADANELGTEVVSSGTIAIDEWANKVHTGLAYMSQVETMPIVLTGREGTSAGRKARIATILIDFYETLNVELGTDSDNLDDVIFPDLDEDPIPIFTGWRPCPFLRGYYRDPIIYLQTDAPLPMCIRGIVPKMEVTE